MEPGETLKTVSLCPMGSWAQLARATHCQSWNPLRNNLLTGTVHSQVKLAAEVHM